MEREIHRKKYRDKNKLYLAGYSRIWPYTRLLYLLLGLGQEEKQYLNYMEAGGGKLNNPYISNDEGIIRFDLCRLEKNKEKLCKCENPHFEV
ncbi:MAG: hypothetical protein LBN31_07855, partial [Hungatella sp.]|nr:hypothetical protein [Hungatella sp.]